ncbi:MAG: transcriptional repressor [Proteobacteria bacterium]|nr:transcriptional repressor [Pseudomonadota bacterium]
MNNYSHILRNLKLKVTPKRLEILNILGKRRYFMSPEEIWKEMKIKFKKIGLPTVYRNLEEMAEGGVIFRVIHTDRQLYYYLCNNKNHHHHFVCLSCKRVYDIDYCPEIKIVEFVREILKGSIISHLFQVNGFCSNCLNKDQGVIVKNNEI